MRKVKLPIQTHDRNATIDINNALAKNMIHHLVEALAVVFVLAGVWISHVGEALRAEGRDAREPHFRAACEDCVADCEVARVVDTDDVAWVSRLRTRIEKTKLSKAWATSFYQQHIIDTHAAPEPISYSYDPAGYLRI